MSTSLIGGIAGRQPPRRRRSRHAARLLRKSERVVPVGGGVELGPRARAELCLPYRHRQFAGVQQVDQPIAGGLVRRIVLSARARRACASR